MASFIERALARMLLDVACKNVRSVDSLDCYIFVASVQSCMHWFGEVLLPRFGSMGAFEATGTLRLWEATDPPSAIIWSFPI